MQGLIADGVVSDEEMAYLTSWLQANRDALNQWPANVLATRVEQIIEDRVVDTTEREDLFSLLCEVVGKGSVVSVGANLSTTLPLTKPAPPVFFTKQQFCLTGRFFFGLRAACEREIISRGGLIQSNVTLQTNYLVIGTIGSTDWIHTTHGRKIESAVELEKKGHPIALISEQHWTDHLL